MRTLSRFEDVLLRSWEGARGIRYTLFCFLDDGVSLLRMRLVSSALRDMISHHKARIFRQLFVRSVYLGLDCEQQRMLEAIAPYCRHLTITIGENGLDSARTSLQSKRSKKLRSPCAYNSNSEHGPVSAVERVRNQDPRAKWLSLFGQLVNVQSLTLRVHGGRNWSGFTDVEAQLVDIRVAIECADLSRLRVLALLPVQAMGILHLQWSMLHSFGPSLTSGCDVWRRLETLDLRIHMPFNLTVPQGVMFNKHLHVYLASFAPILRQLCFIWLDGYGPSPVALHYEAGLETRQPIVWTKLEALWLGNVTHLYQTIQLIHDLAPRLSLAMNLHDHHHAPLTVTGRDESAWVEILFDSQTSDADPAVDRGNSMRSEQSSDGQDLSTSGVSSTSMLVPIVLDLG